MKPRLFKNPLTNLWQVQSWNGAYATFYLWEHACQRLKDEAKVYSFLRSK